MKSGKKNKYSIIMTLYLSVLAAAYPLIITDGYNNITETKYIFLIACSVIALLAIVITGIFDKTQELDECLKLYRISAIDIAFGAFLVCVTLSTVLSPYKYTAFRGIGGWYMGYITYLIMFVIYFCVRIFYRMNLNILPVLLVAAKIVMILAICDRFSIYIIPITVRQMEFLSTIGNINWFCGFLSVYLSVIVGIIIFTNRFRILSWLALITTTMALGLLGCEVALIVFVMNLAGYLFICITKGSFVKKYMRCAGIMIMAICVANYCAMHISTYNYDSRSLLLILVGNIPAFIVGLCMMAASFAFGDEYVHPKLAKAIGYVIRVMIALAGIAAIICAVYYLRNNITPEWGNYRGAAYIATIDEIRNAGIRNLSLGVGLDNFFNYMYESPDMASYLNAYYQAPLTNAHCELLTSVINVGIIGTIFYYGFMLVGALKLGIWKTKDGEMWRAIGAVAILTYLANNLLTFSQILSYPILIILIAVMQSEYKNEQ